MEERLGVKLFNRTTRQLSLTPIGQAYYEKCTIILDRVEDANALIQGLQATPKGRLRLTVPYELGLFFLKEMMMGFAKAYPEVTVELELTNRMVDIVEEGFDLALRIGDLTDSSLIAVKLLNMEGGVYASPSFFDHRPLPQTPSGLPLSECLQFTTTQTKSWTFDHPQEGLTEVKPTGRIQVNSMDYMCESAVNGLGIAVINKMIAMTYVQQGKLVEILQEYKVSFPALFAVYPSRKFLSPNVRAFMDYIKKEVETL